MLDIARDRRKTKKKETEKQKMGKSQTVTLSFIILHFYLEKFFKNHTWKNFVYSAVFVLQFFHLVGYYYVRDAVIKHQHPYRYALVL